MQCKGVSREFDGELMGNWDNNMTRINQCKENHWRTNTSIRRKKQIQKRRTARVTVRDPSREINYLSKVVWDRKIIRVHQVYHLHQNRLARPYNGR